MIAILCKSDVLSHELARFSGPAESALYSADSGQPPIQWLSDILSKHDISVAFYEPSFFVDPAQFKRMSPATKFIILSPSEDQGAAQDALIHGAAAILIKPFTAIDVIGVLSLVAG